MFNKENINNALKNPKRIPKFLSKILNGVSEILDTIMLPKILINESNELMRQPVTFTLFYI